MATSHGLHSARAARLRLLATGIAVVASLLAFGENASASTTSPNAVPAYSWPVKPFDRQHPVRGFFGDPRIGMTSKGIGHSFHFGVDVACPNGTPVYATVDGTVVLESFRPETVAVVADDERTELEYWHIEPSVRDGQRVVANVTVVGRVLAPWAHVHFSERRDGVYVNPLRPGAMGPYSDTTTPSVRSLAVERDGHAVTQAGVRGRVDLIVSARDRTPIPVSGPWHGKPVMPAVIRWRVTSTSSTQPNRWHVAWDVRQAKPDDALYFRIYARWTRQNKAHQWGRYRVILAHGLDVRSLGEGRHEIEVQVADTRGNTSTRRFPLVVGA